VPVDWYAARAAGVVAYLLLTAVVLVGLTLSGRANLGRWPKFVVTELHRFGSLLVGVFVGIHVLAIALDSYTPFSVAQLVVPFTSAYRPFWVALGIVSAELLVAVAVTNALKSRISYRLWRRAHFATFLVWGGATLHGLGAGTDSGSMWLAALYAVCVGFVSGALAWRIARSRAAILPASARVSIL
jgi:methionine sulfoxide reductase heme-binding subunit